MVGYKQLTWCKNFKAYVQFVPKHKLPIELTRRRVRRTIARGLHWLKSLRMCYHSKREHVYTNNNFSAVLDYFNAF